MSTKTIIFFLATIAFSAASVIQYKHDPSEIEHGYGIYSPEDLTYELHRVRRSELPDLPSGSNDNKGWEINPTIGRDDSGNTKTNVEVIHKGEDHEINAGWGKVVNGPNKAKPTWHVGGTFRW